MADNNENYISEEDIQLICDMLDEATENEIYEQTQVSWDMLKQSAINFIRSYKNLELLEKTQNQK